MNILFLASGAFALPSLRTLVHSHHKILHILSQPDRPAGRGNKLTPTPVSQFALDHNLPLTRTENANAPDILALIKSLKPDALVVIAFGQKLSEELLNLAPHRAINLHSSLLPKYRGAAPINWAVINNDPTAGVCVIDVTPIMDAGDILASASTPIGPSETAGELHDRLAELGAPLLPNVLDQLAANSATRISQENSLATRAPKLSRDLAWIDFNQPAPLVSARIRGLSPWPGVQLQIPHPQKPAPTIVTVLKCQITTSTHSYAHEDRGLILPDKSIACETGSLQLLQLQPQGKKPMDLAAFRNGHPFDAGIKVQSLIPPPTR